MKTPTVEVGECHSEMCLESPKVLVAIEPQMTKQTTNAKGWEVSRLHSLGFWRVSQIPPFLHAQKHFWETPCMAHQIPKPVTSQVKLCSQTYCREVWTEPNDLVFSLRNSLHFSESLHCSLERLSYGGDFWTLTWRRKAFSKGRMALGYSSFRKNWAHPPLCFHCANTSIIILHLLCIYLYKCLYPWHLAKHLVYGRTFVDFYGLHECKECRQGRKISFYPNYQTIIILFFWS